MLAMRPLTRPAEISKVGLGGVAPSAPRVTPEETQNPIERGQKGVHRWASAYVGSGVCEQTYEWRGRRSRKGYANPPPSPATPPRQGAGTQRGRHSGERTPPLRSSVSGAQDVTGLNESSLLFYNNVLGLPLMLVWLVFGTDELSTVFQYEHVFEPSFMVHPQTRSAPRARQGGRPIRRPPRSPGIDPTTDAIPQD